MNDGALIGALAVFLIFGSPVVAILTYHHRKVLEIKLRLKQSADQGVLDEIRKLQGQVTELRDTTTQYDMSFDSALQRIDARVANLESRVATVEQTAQQAHSATTPYA